MIYLAPYKNFRHVDEKTGLELRFPNGRREVSPDDREQIAAIKRIPESKGIVTDRRGKAVNKRAPRKRSAKRDKDRH
jgi:hypothetical protein